MVQVALVNGAVLQGRVTKGAQQRLTDVFNNMSEPFFGFSLGSDPQASPSGVIRLSEVAWIRPLEDEPPSADQGMWIPKQARTVQIRAGVFDIIGTAHTLEMVRWNDFLTAAGRQLLSLNDVQVSGPRESFNAPFVAVNAPAVSALIALADG
jgi:hypothetical protein